MQLAFYLTSFVAVAATLMAITRSNAVHALLYLMVSLLSVALLFFLLGAPLVGALEILIYAGAIVVLFVFVVMLLNMGPDATEQEKRWLAGRVWIGPAVLVGLLLAELLWILGARPASAAAAAFVGPKEVGLALFGPYVLGVQLAGMLLLSGLIGAFHLGRRHRAGR